MTDTTSLATIFLVDDDSSVRKALGRLLSSVGHKVEAFGSAEEFLDAGIPKEDPCCLVLDIHLGGMSGLDLFQTLKASGVVKPTVFITAHDDETIRQRVLNMGAQLLIKPVEEKSLMDAISTALAN